jgi:parvulin-like peptidyl-prolyl isomerase
MSLKVNGTVISNQIIADEMERMRPEYERTFTDLTESQRETQLCAWATENVIERVLLHQQARLEDMEIPDEQIDATVKQLHAAYEDKESLYAALDCQDDSQVRDYALTSIKAERMLEGVRETARKPDAAGIEQFFSARRDQYQVPERVHAAHIVINTDWQTDENVARERIEQAQAELQKGTPFHLVAEKFSDCPERGGDLGFFVKGQMVEEFEDVVFNLGTGQVSDIFRSRYGLHIATVYQREPAAESPLEEVRERVEEDLTEQLRNDAVYAFIDSLKAKADIQKGT